MIRVFAVVGTRPEAIKMAPVIRAARARRAAVELIVCTTGQHRDLAAEMLRHFEIFADVELSAVVPGQSMSELTARLVQQLDGALATAEPDWIVVQGDTSTALAAAMAAFYRRVPLVHVEAGLRTGHLDAPWPEEFNRRVVGLSAALHCAPTADAAANLLAEGISPQRIEVTGNTVVDALLWTLKRRDDPVARECSRLTVAADRQLVLITSHRRESFGRGLENICRAVLALAGRFSSTDFVFCLHPNPAAQTAARRLLAGTANVQLCDPLSYPEFVSLMARSTLILTDSGGIQEEAPTLGIPVLVARETSERPEAIRAGYAQLVGTSVARIVTAATLLLQQQERPPRRINGDSPYGDGRAGERIISLLIDRHERRPNDQLGRLERSPIQRDLEAAEPI